MSNKKYRKYWVETYGNIPIDENGRTYEIHHIDGNHNNNDINNLMCISIQEHYNIHYNNGDYGACVMIAKRMNLPPDYLSKIQTGVKRPGIGGVKKGTIPWNKGKSGYKLNLSEESRKKMGLSSKNRPNRKINDSDIRNIIKDYKDKVDIFDTRLGKLQKNGKLFTYERAFSHHYGKLYDVSETYIFYLIKKYVI
jgi:hypothetical protein